MINIGDVATTRDGLREQAKTLGIAGRGSMNKAQLEAAVKAALGHAVPVAQTQDTPMPAPTPTAPSRPSPRSVFGGKRPEAFAVTVVAGTPTYRTPVRQPNRVKENAEQRAARDQHWRALGSRVRAGARLK
jgi:hypothetical protein